ncbi:MAG: type II toxin-antitoxin system RelE/ParE family toxin [Cyanobacteria bacterium P01_A01_bin.17]
MFTEYLTIVETPHFEREAKGLLDENALMNLKLLLAAKPEAGNVIKDSNGLRKLRFAIGNKGKSGGVRVIYYYYNSSLPVFLLDVYAKNRKENLSQAELNELSKLTELLRLKGGKNAQ